MGHNLLGNISIIIIIIIIMVTLINCLLNSLLKVHLQLRGFSVFIDVERLEAGKFDNNLLNSIKQAKHFILVLTPNALDRCIGDSECKDWIHRVRLIQLLLSIT